MILFLTDNKPENEIEHFAIDYDILALKSKMRRLLNGDEKVDGYHTSYGHYEVSCLFEKINS